MRNDTAAPAGELSLRDAVPLVGVTSPSLVVAMATMPRPTPGNPPGSYCPVSGTSQVAIRNVCADFGAELREFNSETGHVHLLVRYPPRVALSRLVGSLKSVSARRLRQEFPGHIRKYLRGEHFWSPSYFAASCGGAPLAIIKHGITPVGTSEAKSRQPLPDVPGFFVEQVAGAGRPVRADAEAVARETGEDVQMEVEDLLEGGLAVGEEHIHALTGHARLRLTGNDGTKNASTLILAAHREMIPRTADEANAVED